MSSSTSNKKTFSSTEYNFSLLADPNKIKNIDKTVIVRNNKMSDSESIKSNLIEINDPPSDIKFNDNISNENLSNKKSPKSSKSSLSSKSTSSITRKSRQLKTNDEIFSKEDNIDYNNNNSNYNINNYKEPDKKVENKLETTLDPKLETKLPKQKKENIITYLHENDDYDECDEQDKRIKKMEKFAQLMYIKSCGRELSKKYDMGSDYWEMCAEIKFHTDFENKKQGVELAKDFLIYACTGIEFLNDQFNPFRFNLKGWADHVKSTKENYTDIFKELYEKYKGKGGKIEPEVKLLFLIIISAGSFHAQKMMADKIPGLDNILKNNPELMSKMETMISEKITGPPSKTPEEIQKETEYKLYQQMIKEREIQKEKINNIQINDKQMNDKQMNDNQINSTNIFGTSIPSTLLNTQQDKISILQEQKLQQQIKTQGSIAPNFQSILSKVTNNNNLNLNEVQTTIPFEDNQVSVSSINTKSRIEVTETLHSGSESYSSYNSNDINIKQSRRKRMNI